jgi:hypothetical protein
VALVELGVTTAENVTVCPTFTPFTVVSWVVVVPAVTTSENTGETLAAAVARPPYAAVMLCVPPTKAGLLATFRVAV